MLLNDAYAVRATAGRDLIGAFVRELAEDVVSFPGRVFVERQQRLIRAGELRRGQASIHVAIATVASGPRAGVSPLEAWAWVLPGHAARAALGACSATRGASLPCHAARAALGARRATSAAHIRITASGRHRVGARVGAILGRIWGAGIRCCAELAALGAAGVSALGAELAARVHSARSRASREVCGATSAAHVFRAATVIGAS